MRMMEILTGIIAPAILFSVAMAVLYTLSNTLNASAMGLGGGIFMLVFVWVMTAVIIKTEKKNSKRYEAEEALN